jgi:hypothetical protein
LAQLRREFAAAENAPSREAPSAADTQAQASKPPVAIARGRDWRLVISSQDPAALDLLEDLVREMAPHRKDFEIFQLKYAPAFWVRLNLQDFFKEDDKKTNRNDLYRRWYWDMPAEESKDDPRRLSQRRPLKFISDDDTNTIVVQGADPQQLQTVAQLIELYDQPPPEDAQSLPFAIRGPTSLPKRSKTSIATYSVPMTRPCNSSNSNKTSGRPAKLTLRTSVLGKKRRISGSGARKSRFKGNCRSAWMN